ncbi:hypothetical protein ACIQU4_15760 [Streptomyces sp. NPDC090741]|uniref:hypothetical protein n=1 Tax=Streptomyces sp. NPDC090741 TaxID=3365967 RepID=UPI003820863E
MAAAAAVALIGAFSGLFIGRSQLRDQAQVEHGQWLRGQRQEAFVALIAAWDEVISRLEERVLSDESLRAINDTDSWDEAFNACVERVTEHRRPFRKAAERVQMLGPESVDQAVSSMLATVEKLAAGLGAQYVGPPEDDPRHMYISARSEVDASRAAFLDAARSALHQTPDTKRP